MSTVRKFGRLLVRDDRDRRYPVRALLPRRPAKQTVVMWDDGTWSGDQRSTPQCVAYAGCSWIEDGPVSPIYRKGKHPPLIKPATLYAACQKVDGIPGRHDGTTVRALAKVLKTRGIIESYHWAFSLADAQQTLLTLGPMVLGLDWYEGMMEPGADGFLRPTGEVVGGHGIECNGIDVIGGYFRLKNSWGLKWGQNGHAKLAFADFAKLLKAEGEAMIALEKQERA